MDSPYIVEPEQVLALSYLKVEMAGFEGPNVEAGFLSPHGFKGVLEKMGGPILDMEFASYSFHGMTEWLFRGTLPLGLRKHGDAGVTYGTYKWARQGKCGLKDSNGIACEEYHRAAVHGIWERRKATWWGPL